MLLLPPIEFMALARVVWASREMEPYDMAPVQKRLTISFASSTCTQSAAIIPAGKQSQQAPSPAARRLLPRVKQRHLFQALCYD